MAQHATAEEIEAKMLELVRLSEGRNLDPRMSPGRSEATEPEGCGP